MMTLLLTLCLANGVCKDHRAEASGLNERACVMWGQMIAAQDPFVRLHPEYRVAGWRCVAEDGGKAL